jgi:hypothetical protein
MKECKLVIQIDQSAEDVFQFTLNPNNTPLWIDSIVREKTNESPTRIGTIYRNVNNSGVWSEYTVTQYEENKRFEFISSDNNYHVRYIFTPLDNESCELEYYEWVEHGELEEPFTMEILEKLKKISEK